MFVHWQHLPLAVVLLLSEGAIASNAMSITSPYSTSSAASPTNSTLFNDEEINNSSAADPTAMKTIGDHNRSDGRNMSDASKTVSPSIVNAVNATNYGKEKVTNIYAFNSTDMTVIGNEDIMFVQALGDTVIPNNETETTVRNNTGGVIETDNEWITSNDGTSNDIIWPFALNGGSSKDDVTAQLKGGNPSADINSTTHVDTSKKKDDPTNIVRMRFASLRDFLRKSGKQINRSNAQILSKALNSSAVIQQFLTQTKTTTIYVSGEEALRQTLWAILQQKYGSVTSKNGTSNP